MLMKTSFVMACAITTTTTQAIQLNIGPFSPQPTYTPSAQSHRNINTTRINGLYSDFNELKTEIETLKTEDTDLRQTNS